MQILSPQTNSTSKSFNFVTILLPTGSIHFNHSHFLFLFKMGTRNCELSVAVVVAMCWFII